MHDTDRVIVLDHSYSQHWSESYKADTSHAQPIAWILPKYSLEERLKKTISARRKACFSEDDDEATASEEEVDIESLDDVMSPSTVGSCTYDLQKSRFSLNESAKFVQHLFKSGRPEMDEELWTSKLNQPAWTVTQLKLFNKVLNLLDEEKLARLGSKGVHNEAIIRRLSINKSAAKLRHVFVEFSWDQKLCQWLHNIMFNNLPATLLVAYIDIMQTLRSKVPGLVERMIISGTSNRVTNTESLNILLKKPWDPTYAMSTSGLKTRFSPSPFILIVQCITQQQTPSMTRRNKLWISLLGQIGKVVQLSTPTIEQGTTVNEYLQQLAKYLLNKIQSIKLNHPANPIVLVGWDVASILNCHISLMEQVSALVCLGFPMFSINGSRADVDDDLCDLSTPTLFVVGEDTSTCNINSLEDMRERLLTKAKTSLVAIAGANEHLCVSAETQRQACITQTLIDRMILEKVEKFLQEKMLRTNSLGTFLHTNDKFLDGMGKRKRSFDEHYPGNTKKRRPSLSASVVSQIKDALSGKNLLGNSKDEMKTPVQGVTFNLQTGTVSPLATVPTSLGAKSTKDTAAPQKRKYNKKKSIEGSVTIDISKDTKKQINSYLGYRRKATDQTLVPSEQQTEAAVATILGTSDKNDVVEVPQVEPLTTATSQQSISKPNSSHLQSTTTSPLSAFTRLSPSNIPSLSSIVPSISPQNTSPQGSVTAGSGASLTFGHLASLSSISPAITTITSTQADSKRTTASFGKYSSYLSGGSSLSTIDTSALGFSSSSMSSRSSKDEKETLQATSILEQLSNPVDNDSMTSLLSRRHSLDPTFLCDPVNSNKTINKPKLVKKQKNKIVKRRQSFATTTQLQKAKLGPGNNFKYMIPASTSNMLRNAAAKPGQSRPTTSQSHQIIIAPSGTQQLATKPTGTINIMEVKQGKNKEPTAKPKIQSNNFPVIRFPQPPNTLAKRINFTRQPGQRGFALVSLPSSMFKTNKPIQVAKPTAVNVTAARMANPLPTTKTSVVKTTIVTPQPPATATTTNKIMTTGTSSPKTIVHLRNKALIINKKPVVTPVSTTGMITVKRIIEKDLKTIIKPPTSSTSSVNREVINVKTQSSSPTVILKKLSPTTVETMAKKE